MASRRTDAKQQIEEWKPLFDILLNKPARLIFAKFDFPGVIVQSIELAKTTGMVNAPKKRIDSDGKPYTPNVMEITTNNGPPKGGLLRFVIEDTTVAGIANGVRLTAGKTTIDLRLE